MALGLWAWVFSQLLWLGPGVSGDAGYGFGLDAALFQFWLCLSHGASALLSCLVLLSRESTLGSRRTPQAAASSHPPREGEAGGPTLTRSAAVLTGSSWLNAALLFGCTFWGRAGSFAEGWSVEARSPWVMLAACLASGGTLTAVLSWTLALPGLSALAESGGRRARLYRTLALGFSGRSRDWLAQRHTTQVLACLLAAVSVTTPVASALLLFPAHHRASAQPLTLFAGGVLGAAALLGLWRRTGKASALLGRAMLAAGSVVLWAWATTLLVSGLPMGWKTVAFPSGPHLVAWLAVCGAPQALWLSWFRRPVGLTAVACVAIAGVAMQSFYAVATAPALLGSAAHSYSPTGWDVALLGASFISAAISLRHLSSREVPR